MDASIRAIDTILAWIARSLNLHIVLKAIYYMLNDSK